MSDHGENQASGSGSPIAPGSQPIVDAPTIGQPTVMPAPQVQGAPQITPGYGPPPTGQPVTIGYGPPPTGQPIIGRPMPPQPTGPARGPRSSTVALVMAGVIGLVVSVGALLVVITSGGDDPVASAGDTTTTLPSASTTTLSPTTETTQSPTTASTTMATTSQLPTDSGLRGMSEVPYGSYVAMLWSERLDGDSQAHAANARAAKTSYYGVPTAVVYGDDFRTLKDGTVAVVYAGPFTSPRDAAQWCLDRGVTDADACIGVGLNDDYTEQDRNGTGRMYISDF